jgi:carboxylesterase
MSRLSGLALGSGYLPTLARALPFSIDPPGAREAVLLLHGLSGNPSELMPVGKALAALGYAVSAPRHPGHGSSQKDLLRCRSEDWLRSSIDAYLDLRSRYSTVHVLGHSMGGLLATLVASAFDAPKLMLLAPAYELCARKSFLYRLEALFRKVRRRDRPIPEADRDSPDLVRMHREYWIDELVFPIAQLFRLASLAKRVLPTLGSRVLVVVGELDEVVPTKVAPYIARKAAKSWGVETRTLAGAGHIFPFDKSSAQAAAIVADWLGPSKGSGA